MNGILKDASFFPVETKHFPVHTSILCWALHQTQLALAVDGWMFSGIVEAVTGVGSQVRSLPSHLHPVPLLVQKGGSNFSRHEPRLACDERVTAESLALPSELHTVYLGCEDRPTFLHSTHSCRVPTACQGSFWARVTSVGGKNPEKQNLAEFRGAPIIAASHACTHTPEAF